MMDSRKRNLRMTVAYDGSAYAGFQRQAGHLPTIQGVLEERIQRITGEHATITGAGRTDAGVHARGQVVNFFCASALPEAVLQKALNSLLPRDMAILSVEEAAPDFHARFHAKHKTYSYRIYTGPVRPVFERNFVYFHKYRLDYAAMAEAAGLLVGTKDFRSFQAAGSAVVQTVRTVNSCLLTQDGPEIRLAINADGFLYHMVRNIVGTLLLVGNGRMSREEFEQLILAKDRQKAGPTAPACGLCLEAVFY
ncbi:tRNA pseudouridine38-40 synthase [Hydrogenispora ethanolica]|uniref:tRNA pseudouridine synthase A n=1 Tax=Hydrogenispora ethanolica TaxID=1082276 RepID=A0A4R1RKW7_HYDET|nr:tRNA pseudouridine(38-40) synthase TruA [Hydrogenispora ethanolica]TCL66490.1 tRNA pseudouridine38-40 synthase [Hydrogenispora ethanolica]